MPPGTGPLSGVKVIEIASIGPGPFAAMMLADAGADVIRLERAGRRGGARLGIVEPHSPRPALGRLRSQASGGPRARAAPRRVGRRPDRGLPPRGDGAPRPRSRRAARPQPATRLRADDRLGAGRADVGAGRPRRQLHLDRRRARLVRPPGGAPALPAQPRRRLRGRGDDARLRRPGGRHLGAGDRRGPGRRRRDGRGLVAARDADPLDAGHGDVGGRGRHQPARLGGALLRGLRDRRRRALRGRRARAAVLRRAPPPARARPRGVPADGARPLGRDEADVRGGLHDHGPATSGRTSSPARRPARPPSSASARRRRIRTTGRAAASSRSARPSSRRRRRASAGRPRACRPRRPSRARTPTRRSRPGGSAGTRSPRCASPARSAERRAAPASRELLARANPHG